MILYPHQQQIIDCAKRRAFYAVFAACGLGKTLCAIKLIEYRDMKTLVIAPNSVLENWVEEIQKFSKLSCVMLQGTKLKRIRLLKTPYNVYILNYEALRILYDELTAARFGMMICDESQKIKGYKTQQSKVAAKLGQAIPNRLIMTGTPITNNYLDVFGQYRFLNPHIFGFSFYRFRARYALMGGYMNYEVKQWINIDELKQKLYTCAIMIKNDCLDLPEKLYQTYLVDLPPEQRKVYDELKKDFISELQGEVITAAYVLTRLIRFAQITSGFLKTAEGKEVNFKSNPKLIWLREFIEDLPQDEQVVIFFRFIKELKNLRLMFEDMKIKYVEIYGETKHRQDKINEFQRGDARIFLGQIDVAGLGINLFAARYCIFLSNSYSYGVRHQAEQRLHRIGQKRNVTYIDVICRNSLDLTILKCLKNKKSLADFILESPNKDGVL